MNRWTLWLAIVASIGLLGCGPEKLTMPPCDLDVEALTGDWVSLTGSGSGTDKPDKFARIRFYEEGGKRKAMYTAGQIAPGNPATNKYVYDYVEKTQLGDVMYMINMFPDKSPQRIERLRKDNRRLDVKFEGRIYVKVNMGRCALTVSDMYVTYVKGEETMDSNPAGTRTYLRANPQEPELSFVHCDETGQLIPFDSPSVDWTKEPVPLTRKAPKEGDCENCIHKGTPAWFHYVEKRFEGSADEVKEQLTKAGVYAEEGATYDYEIWMKDIRYDALQKVATVADPEDDNRIPWIAEINLDSAPIDGIFVEMHRYKTVGGERTLLGNACTVIWPEAELDTSEEEAPTEE